MSKPKKCKSSTQSDEVQKFAELAKKLPDIRQEKIDAIKKKIEAGTYNVSTDCVAKSIIESHKELVSARTPKKKCHSQ